MQAKYDLVSFFRAVHVLRYRKEQPLFDIFFCFNIREKYLYSSFNFAKQSKYRSMIFTHISKSKQLELCIG